MDYLVGFNISPILWTKLPGSKSAGRVQSVALKLITEREKEIELFNPEEYWTLSSDFTNKDNKNIISKLSLFNGEKVERFTFKNKEEINKALDIINKSKFKISDVNSKVFRRNPLAPFTTSTLQQTASGRFGFGASRTMQIAQRLYQGIDIEGETTGLITYMRTDSVFLSNSFLSQAKSHISEKYGENYSKTRQFSNKGKSQNAHEAIRPTNLSRVPSSAPLLKLYNLIVNRTLASQMSPHKFDEEITRLKTNDDLWEISTKHTTFDGFKILSNSIYNDKKFNAPINDDLDFKEVSIEEYVKDTKPPYNLSTAVKMMEVEGIGRPSTYASILDKLQDRMYVSIETNETKIIENRKIVLRDSQVSSSKTIQKKGGQKNCLILTELGKKVTDFFESNLKQTTSSKLTAD